MRKKKQKNYNSMNKKEFEICNAQKRTQKIQFDGKQTVRDI